ncbi:MAG: DoxX family protein [Actinomycetota bacterium]|nr:DoxX family protein [Actinomycetota bacterium]
MQQLNFALFVLRVVFGVFLAAHGFNKVFGGGKLAGTAGWFGSMGMKWPKWQARIAAATEIGAGLMFAAGLLTALAAAGMIALMVVAIVTVHWKVGFFVFKPNQGWEYCASIAFAAFAVATVGAGEWSLDHAFEIDWFSEWKGAIVAGVVGVGGALAQLGVSYRPPKASK